MQVTGQCERVLEFGSDSERRLQWGMWLPVGMGVVSSFSAEMDSTLEMLAEVL